MNRLSEIPRKKGRLAQIDLGQLRGVEKAWTVELGTGRGRREAFWGGKRIGL